MLGGPILTGIIAAVLLPIAQAQPANCYRVEVYQLKYADAETCYKTLCSTDVEIRFTWDTPSNSVFFLAPSGEKSRKVREVLDRLDVRRESGLRVIFLKHAQAAKTSRDLQAIMSLLTYFCISDRPILMSADARTNTVAFSAREDWAPWIIHIARWLDVPEN